MLLATFNRTKGLAARKKFYPTGMFHMGWSLTDLIRASKRNLNTRVKGEETEIEGEKK